ncbi:MAG: hypothetical protein WC389_17100 [Lutibacter sp.]
MHSMRNYIPWKYHKVAKFPRLRDCMFSRVHQGIVVPTIIKEYTKKKKPGVIFFILNHKDPREAQKGINDFVQPTKLDCHLDDELNTTTYRVWERNQNKFVEYPVKELKEYKETGVIIRENPTENGRVLFIVRQDDVDAFRQRPI